LDQKKWELGTYGETLQVSNRVDGIFDLLCAGETSLETFLLNGYIHHLLCCCSDGQLVQEDDNEVKIKVREDDVDVIFYLGDAEMGGEIHECEGDGGVDFSMGFPKSEVDI
jgi:hypothetical protein